MAVMNIDDFLEKIEDKKNDKSYGRDSPIDIDKFLSEENQVSAEPELREGNFLEQASKGILTGMGQGADFVESIKNKILPEKWQIPAGTHEAAGAKLYNDIASNFTDSPDFKRGVTQEIAEFFAPGAFDKPGKAVKLLAKIPGGINLLKEIVKKLSIRAAESTGAVAGKHIASEMTDNNSWAELAGTIGGSLAVGKGIGKFSAPKNTLSEAEQDVARILQKDVDLEKIKNMPDSPSYYSPTTAELSGDTALSQYERARLGSSPQLSEKKLSGVETVQNLFEDELTNAKQSLNWKTLPPEEAGTAIEESARNEARLLNHIRQKQAKPYYDLAEESDKVIPYEETKAALTELIENAASEDASYYEKLKRALAKHSQIGLETSDTYKKDFEDVWNSIGNEKIKEQLKELKPSDPKTGIGGKVLNEERKKIKKRIDKADKNILRQGEAHDLGEIEHAISKDLEAIPEWSEANKKYAEFSKDYNKLTENKFIKDVLKEQPGYSGAPTVPRESIFKQITEGYLSRGKAKVAMSLLEKRPAQLEKVKASIRDKFMASAFDAEGNISIQRIKKFSQQNPGVSILYPNLKDDIVVNRIINKGLMEDIHKNAVMPGTPGEFNRYMKRNGKFIDEFLTPQQRETLDKVNKIYTAKLNAEKLKSTGGQSSTASNLTLLGKMDNPKSNKAYRYLMSMAVDSLLPFHGATATNIVYDLFGSFNRNKGSSLRMEVLDKVLNDPEYAKLVLSTPLKDEKHLKDFMDSLRSYTSKYGTKHHNNTKENN